MERYLRKWLKHAQHRFRACVRELDSGPNMLREQRALDLRRSEMFFFDPTPRQAKAAGLEQINHHVSDLALTKSLRSSRRFTQLISSDGH